MSLITAVILLTAHLPTSAVNISSLFLTVLMKTALLIIRNRRLMKTCCNKTCNMSHINHKHSTVCMCNISHSLKINFSRISRSACYNKLRLNLINLLSKFLIINKTLRGPRGGLILCNNEYLIKKLNSAVFPGTQGGPLKVL